MSVNPGEGKTALQGAAVSLPMVEPEKVGLSRERLGRIQPALQRYVDAGRVPGTVSLVARHGKVAHLEATGFRDVENGQLMTVDTIFRIASMTKPITSVALMMLFEEGGFLLSDPVSKWIPEFGDVKVAERTPARETTPFRPFRLVTPHRPITIRHLLTHTSGLSSAPRTLSAAEIAALTQRQTPNQTIGDFVKRYAKIPLNSHPGDRWEYSLATCVVGHLVEIMSGMSLDEYFRERIFKPLGMPDTHFYLPAEKLPRFAAAYGPDENERIRLLDAPTRDSHFVKGPPTYFMGSGGLLSTAGDYFRFDQMMLSGGELDGVRLLGRSTVEFMTRNHVGDMYVDLPGPYIGFGLGFGVVRDPEQINGMTNQHPGPMQWSVGTYSWGGAFCTLSWVDPKEDLIGIVMTQVLPYTHLNFRPEFVGLTYQALVD